MADHANRLFEQRLYEQAFPYYMKLKDMAADNVVYQFRAGVCAIYESDPDDALTLIKASYDKDPNIPMINFFLGRAYLINDKYDDALVQFNLQLAKETDDSQKTRLTQYLTNCTEAKELAEKPTGNTVVNAGRPINSPGDEYAPILFNNDSSLIFTYKGPESTGGKTYFFGKNDSAGIYHEDVFESALTTTGWFEPQSISPNVNTAEHDAGAALSPDGQTLYIYRNSPGDGGDIYQCKKNGNDWSKPVRVPGINTSSWEGSVTLSADGNTMYFSSDRPGGLGGKDLYKATWIKDSAWGDITNLGPAINSPLDDDAPYLYPDGKKLVFSSRGNNSMGGYDIFYCELADDGTTWNAPVNYGIPVNSVYDDIYFMANKDGSKAVFSSNRNGGNGMMDIYFVVPGTPVTDVVTINGTVTLDDKPIDASISVGYSDKSDVQGDYNADTSGNYSLHLPAGQNYKITYMVSNEDDQVKNYDATTVKGATTEKMDIQFYSDDYKMKHPEKFGSMSKADSAKTKKTQSRYEMLDAAEDIVSISDSAKYYKHMDDSIAIAPGMYIVIGSFVNKDYAKRLAQKVMSGKTPYPQVARVLNTQTGFMYVTVAHPTTKEEAIDMVKKVRKEYKDAWVETLH